MFYYTFFYHFFDLFKKTILVFYKLFSLYVLLILTAFVAIFKSWVAIFIYNIKKIRIDFFFLFLFLSQNFIFSFIFTSYIYYCLRNSIVYNDSPTWEGLILFSATTLICISLNKHTQQSKGAAVIPNNSKPSDDNLIEVPQNLVKFYKNNNKEQNLRCITESLQEFNLNAKSFASSKSSPLLKKIWVHDYYSHKFNSSIVPLSPKITDFEGNLIVHKSYFSPPYMFLKDINNPDLWLFIKPSLNIDNRFKFVQKHLEEFNLGDGVLHELGYKIQKANTPFGPLHYFSEGKVIDYGISRFLLGPKSIILEFYNFSGDTSFFFSEDLFLVRQNFFGLELKKVLLDCASSSNKYKNFFNSLYLELLQNQIFYITDFKFFCKEFLENNPSTI